jgi:hypothetical protein
MYSQILLTRQISFIVHYSCRRNDDGHKITVQKRKTPLVPQISQIIIREICGTNGVFCFGFPYPAF